MSDNTGQSESTGGVEQITKVPSIAPKREKDPKRVVAGKKLAESNKQMREEHARYKASEEERRALEAQRVSDAPQETTETSGDLLSQLTLTNVISLVGIGLTVYAIFFKKSGNTGEKPTNTGEKHVAWQEPVNTTLQEPLSRLGVEPKPKTKQRLKFGM